MVRLKERTRFCTMQLSATVTASERIGTARGFTRVLEAGPVRERLLQRTRSMSPKVSASALFAMACVRRMVASTNMRFLKRETDRDPRADRLVRLPVRTVQARAPISPGCAAFTSKADATRGISASSSTLGSQAQLRHPDQGAASQGVKGVAMAVGARKMVPDVPVPRVPERAKVALRDLRARVQRGTATSLRFQPPSVS